MRLFKTMLISSVLIYSSSFSQTSKSYDISWKLTEYQGNTSLNIVGFESGINKIPTFYERIKVNSNSEISLDIEVISSEVLTSQELKGIDASFLENLKERVEINTDYGIQRKIKFALISFPAIYKVQGQVRKIKKFRLNHSIIATANHNVTRSGGSYTSNSVLLNGDIFKLSVSENGIYKVTYEYLKENNVISSSINSSSINIYGNHFGMLPEKNDVFRPDDLEKNAIKIVDGGDGSFDESDYILFYAQGADKWKLKGGVFDFEKHLYSDFSFYFLKINDNTGAKRIGSISSASAAHTSTVTTFNDFAAKEDERINLMNILNRGGSGKVWLGDVFDVSLSRNYSFNFPNIDIASTVTAKTRVLGNILLPNSCSFRFSSGSNNTNISINGLSNWIYGPLARLAQGSLSFTPSSSTVGINLTFIKPAGISATGYLDFIEINARRNMIMHDNQMEFRDLNSVGSGLISKFVLSGSSDVNEVWDVTNPATILNVNFSRSGSSIDFQLDTDSLRTFIAYKNAGFLEPNFVEKVSNQDLHGQAVPDMLIVYHELFENQVDQLKQFHESNGLTVIKATVEEIYNEFSGGMPDVTAIKTFAKMYYDRGGLNPPSYLLLFGDGTFDYKNRVKPNHNFVPLWESEDSYSPITSFTTDDFYALLDDSESMLNSEMMDIAVGRLTVTNASQAQAVVNKIINYQKQEAGLLASSHCNSASSASPFGDWRNKICFITDDVDNAWERDFFLHTESIIDSVVSNHPYFNIKKIHSDSYKQTSVSGGERYYEAAEELRRAVEEGVLITTYEGHGGEVGWATERFLDVPTVTNWTNSNRLTVFLTATCEFTKYDDPLRTSAGELCLLNPNGGAVGLFTTTRAVTQNSNEKLIDAFFKEVFVKKSDGTPRTLGEIYMETKNNAKVIGDGNARRFSLIGDPALNLAFPKHEVVTTEINNKPVGTNVDTLKALSKITVKGKVVDASGSTLTNYNGIVYPTVFDKPTQLTTLGNLDPAFVFPFKEQKSIIYKGKATVKNGVFEFTFLVPKDINYQFGKGKISYYCFNGNEDGTGYYSNAIVGGTDLSAKVDKNGPELGLFMNDNNFVSGGITDESPSIYAELFDSNGINTTGNGIGHNLLAILDEKTSNPIVLNNHYESDIDSYQSGKINYPLSNLTEGNHTISLKAWDIHNNSNEKSIDFVVIMNEELAIDHVLNYPNPFTTRTQFFFEHNQHCEFLEVQIQVFTVSGKLVKTINKLVKTEGFRVEGMEWDGKDDYGDKIGRGTYVYKIKVVDNEGNKVEKYEKLVLLK